MMLYILVIHLLAYDKGPEIHYNAAIYHQKDTCERTAQLMMRIPGVVRTGCDPAKAIDYPKV